MTWWLRAYLLAGVWSVGQHLEKGAGFWWWRSESRFAVFVLGREERGEEVVDDPGLAAIVKDATLPHLQ